LPTLSTHGYEVIAREAIPAMAGVIVEFLRLDAEAVSQGFSGGRVRYPATAPIGCLYWILSVFDQSTRTVPTRDPRSWGPDPTDDPSRRRLHSRLEDVTERMRERMFTG
jgi:ABC-type transport system substrate-binding protein